MDNYKINSLKSNENNFNIKQWFLNFYAYRRYNDIPNVCSFEILKDDLGADYSHLAILMYF